MYKKASKVPEAFQRLLHASAMEKAKFEALEAELFQSVDYLAEKLIGREVFVRTKSQTISFKIAGKNVPHLLGLLQEGPQEALWKDLKRHNLRKDRLFIKQDGSTFLKIAAMSHTQEMLEVSSRLCKAGRLLNVRFDAGVRTSKMILMIGLENISPGKYVAITALESHKLKLPKSEEILEIYTLKRGIPEDKQERVYLKKKL